MVASIGLNCSKTVSRRKIISVFTSIISRYLFLRKVSQNFVLFIISKGERGGGGRKREEREKDNILILDLFFFFL